jgi:hypothetical protein
MLSVLKAYLSKYVCRWNLVVSVLGVVIPEAESEVELPITILCLMLVTIIVSKVLCLFLNIPVLGYRRSPEAEQGFSSS